MNRTALTILLIVVVVSGCKPDHDDQEVRVFVRDQRRTQIADLTKAIEELNARKESLEKDLNAAQLFVNLNEDNKGRIEKDKKELDIVEQRIAENRAAVRSVLMDLEKSLEGKK